MLEVVAELGEKVLLEVLVREETDTIGPGIRC